VKQEFTIGFAELQWVNEIYFLRTLIFGKGRFLSTNNGAALEEFSLEIARQIRRFIILVLKSHSEKRC
jgi:hypothetical protein